MYYVKYTYYWLNTVRYYEIQPKRTISIEFYQNEPVGEKNAFWFHFTK